MTFYARLQFILIFITLLLFAGCDQKDNNSDETVTLEESIDFLALGDSYTIGQGVEESKRWPNQLVAKLIEENINVNPARIIAQTSWTTKRLLESVNNTEISGLGDEVLVSLLIGVNNQFQNLPFNVFVDEFNLLVSKAIEIAGNSEMVFVVSIPDYGVTPFGSNNSDQIAEEIDRYNNHIAEVCFGLDIPFVNITEISRTLGDADDALATDNLHPSGFQYGKWVEEILPIVIELLKK